MDESRRDFKIDCCVKNKFLLPTYTSISFSSLAGIVQPRNDDDDDDDDVLDLLNDR